jgi:thioredoxin reductase (NADPH)
MPWQTVAHHARPPDDQSRPRFQLPFSARAERGAKATPLLITPDEIGEVPVLGALGAHERERLSQLAADIRLVGGEFAVNEGDEPALFAVLKGRFEVVRMIDGVERVIGERLTGDIFGEVPLTLGTGFPGAYRATESSRVARIDAQTYHTVVAASPEVRAKVTALARKRILGLQDIAAEPAPPRAVVVGHRWDANCTALRQFLDRNQVMFEWIVADAPDAEEAWGGPLPAEDDLPTLRVVDGKTVVRPHLRRVAELLGLPTQPAHAEYDVVIVGAGPAGLAAGVYGAAEGLSTIVIEREAPGGQAGTSARIENYLGFPSGVSGNELAARALQQARRLGAEIIVTRSIARIDAPRHQVHLDGGDVLKARTLILACGVSWRRLPIEGIDRLTGKGVTYGAARSEASNTHGLDVHIVGAGNSAGQAALFFSTHARSVTILCRGDTLEKSMSHYLIEQIATRRNIEVMFGAEVAGVHGEVSLEEIDVRSSVDGETVRLGSGALFIFIGADAETSWLPPEIALDRNGFVLTGPDLRAAGRWEQDRDPYLLETSVPGVFACGDVRLGPVKRVAAAVGEGSMAIAFVHQYLKEADEP